MTFSAEYNIALKVFTNKYIIDTKKFSADSYILERSIAVKTIKHTKFIMREKTWCL